MEEGVEPARPICRHLGRLPRSPIGMSVSDWATLSAATACLAAQLFVQSASCEQLFRMAVELDLFGLANIQPRQQLGVHLSRGDAKKVSRLEKN
jgi:hypothetical protein